MKAPTGVCQLATVGLACTVALTTALVHRADVQRDRALSRLEILSSRRLLVGRDVAWPPELAATVPHGRPELVALLLLSRESCLVCYVELDRWEPLARWQPRLTLAVVILGGDTTFTRQVAQEQALPFPLIPDPDSAITRALGLPATAPQRALFAGGRIALLADGPDEGPTGFAEGLTALLAEGNRQRSSIPRP